MALHLRADGVYFGDFTDAAGEASELFDDYEEGSFSPAWHRQSGDPQWSSATQDGQYTKIGRSVHFNANFSTNSNTSAGSGDWYCGGLPFTSSNASAHQEHAVSEGRIYHSADSGDWDCRVPKNTTYVKLYKEATDTSYTANANYCIMQFTGFYVE